MKVCIFVANPCVADSRVLRQAATFARAGHETVVVALKTPDVEASEERDGFKIRRVLPGHLRKPLPPPVRRPSVETPAASEIIEPRRPLSLVQWIRWIATGGVPAPRSWTGEASSFEQRARFVMELGKKIPRVARRLAGRVLPWRRVLRVLRIRRRRLGLFVRTQFLYGQRRMEKRMTRAGRAFGADLYWANDANTLRAAYEAAQGAGARFFYDAHEAIWGAVAWSRIARGRMSAMERRYAPKADRVFTVCEPIAKAMAQRYRIPKPTVVLNCPRLGETRRAVSHDASPLNGWRKSGETLVLFHGRIAPWRGLEQLVDAVGMLSGFRLIFLGDGKFREPLRKQVEAQGISERVTFLPAVTPAELPNWLTGADVGVIPYQRRGLNHEFSTPNKLFECMHAGVPLVVNELPEVVRIVTEVGFGEVADASDPAALAAAIRKLTSDPARYADMHRRALEAAPRYSWEEQEKLILAAAHEEDPMAERGNTGAISMP